MIVEPSFESMALSEKIGYMAQGMGINRILAISQQSSLGGGKAKDDRRTQ